jgi:hypothetical protein
LLAGHGSRAVVCASAGNLGQALAWSGRGRGLEVTVVASRCAPAAKLDRIRALDARLELVDGDFDMARERAAAIARYDGIRLVEDSADIETCEGAATIGLELAGAVPSFDAVPGPTSHSTRARSWESLGTRCWHQRRARAMPGSGSSGIWPVFQPAADVGGIADPVPAQTCSQVTVTLTWMPGRQARRPTALCWKCCRHALMPK